MFVFLIWSLTGILCVYIYDICTELKEYIIKEHLQWDIIVINLIRLLCGLKCVNTVRSYFPIHYINVVLRLKELIMCQVIIECHDTQ